jgi:hypothetical protein
MHPRPHLVNDPGNEEDNNQDPILSVAILIAETPPLVLRKRREFAETVIKVGGLILEFAEGVADVFAWREKLILGWFELRGRLAY